VTPPEQEIERCASEPGTLGGVGSLTMDPPLDTWGSLLRRRPLATEARTLRAELGLPTDALVVMSGHQPEIWHPGILAKWIAGAAFVRHLAAAPLTLDPACSHIPPTPCFAWLHVDQDAIEPGEISFPAHDEAGALKLRTVTLIEPAPLRDLPPSARLAARVASRGLPDAALPCATEGLARIASTLNTHADAPTLGAQFARTLHDLAEPIAGPAIPLLASQLASTTLFADLVQRMRHDPINAIEAHNLAAAEVPEAGVRPLGLRRPTSPDHPPRVELPLWRVRPGVAREPVMLAHLATIPLSELRPRALLMTALVRLGACDLFVHGLGGGVYDRITDRWLERWLGASDLAQLLPLAPIVVATATCHLPFPRSHAGVTQADALRARQRLHHALHNPALLGDEPAGAQKRSLVAAIRASSDSAERTRLFREMHALLARAREERAQAIGAQHARAEDLARRAAEEPIVNARTWPFPLYPIQTLGTLRTRIEGSLQSAVERSPRRASSGITP
jgi:hypothetical protein